MAYQINNNVRESSTTSGTGAFTLNGAVRGYQSFLSGIGSGNTTQYLAIDGSNTTWELGIGVVGLGTLTRQSIIKTSVGNTALVNFSGEYLSIYSGIPSALAQYLGITGGSGGGGGGSGTGLPTPRTLTSGTTDTAASLDFVIWNSSTASAKTESFPVLSSGATGYITVVDGKGDANTNPITIQIAGSSTANTINGQATFIINTAYQSQSFAFDGVSNYVAI